ncbi:protein-L-isoaspartate O-methyltransferase family protein [Melaminivora alkalimesophila]|uniref:Protein-L-isoaspartate O-methyltransferase n=1 Tax=Melaminivora alkalimesophila TaxID=1165852 RepID=A0A317RF86_9BURK|nr:protein-L-isoaspartate O-methyltransferase [Melaminivora alkalimesophila]PWW46298.1 protein-L-isoaspartate(D-aspartate) O-methyltransferase [Melaminivora alkalimesophila]
MNLPLNTLANVQDPIAHARYNMIEQQIRPWNVLDRGVLDALAAVHREQFVPPGCQGMAFADVELPLTEPVEEATRLGQVMLAPRVEARMLQDLELRPTDKVLEIGAGSGHMAALLGHLAEHVVTLEIVPGLVEFARENLRGAGVQNVDVRQADGALDLIPDGPFDVVVLSGSVAEVPQRLLALLRDGGRLGAIVGVEPMMRMTVMRKVGNGFETSQPWDVVVPRLRNFPEPSPFRF